MHLRRLAALAGGLLFVSTGAVMAAPAGTSAPAPEAVALPANVPSRGLVYDGLTRGGAGSPCSATQFVVDNGPGRPVSCTHGPDASPPDVEIGTDAVSLGAAEAASRSERPDALTSATSAATPAATAGVDCEGDGTSGYRVQAIYARASDKPDRFATLAPMIEGWVAQINTDFDDSAAKTGGSRRPRWVTDGSCNLSILNLVLPTNADDNFSNTTTAVRNLGSAYRMVNRKYLVWMDADVLCGVGELYYDDSPGLTNYNNGRTGIQGLMSRVDQDCWDYAEAHELMHNLGSVQQSAPRKSAAGHCTDEYDRMCYKDGGTVVMSYPCAQSQERLFDCNDNDYFSTNPPSGSYLDTHWNTANSYWLIASAAPPPPPPGPTVPDPPTGVTAVASDGEADVSWTPPADDGGSAITGYTVTSSPGGLTASVDGVTTTATVTGLLNGTSYTFRVTATNAEGTSALSVASTAVKPLGAPVTPKAPKGVYSASTGVLKVTWTAPANGGFAITGYDLYASPGGLIASTTASVRTFSFTATLGTTYTFTVVARNSAGASDPSPASLPVTARKKPTAPTLGTVTPGNGEVTVTWTPPASDGGSPITSYTVRLNTGRMITFPAGSTSGTVTGLTNGTGYTFKVLATNVVGNSPYSGTSARVVPTA